MIKYLGLKWTATMIGLLPIFLALFLMLNGCGSGGSSTTILVFGYRQLPGSGTQVPLQTDPAPTLSITRPPFSAGTTPAISIDLVTPYTGQVHPMDNSNIYEPVNQFAYGRVFNVDPSKTRVVIYVQTNQLYIQPLDSSYCTIYSGDTWYAPVHSGRVLAMVVSNGFQAPATYQSTPVADGNSILAVAQQP